jgi:hypothetical protein
MAEPLTPPLSGAVHIAAALAAGITRRQLDGPGWVRLFPDVYARAATTLDEATWRAAARLAVGPDRVAWGLTAAWLHGVLTPDLRRQPVLDLAAGHGLAHPRRRGQRSARLRLDRRDVVELDGARVTSPERTCFDLARSGSLVDAVVGVDAFLSAGLTSVDRLWRFCQERRRWPYVDRLREAVVLGSDRVRSPAETRLRMLLVLNGLPEPMVNITVHDEAGRRIGTPDLLYLKPLLGIEYDGAYHSDQQVHQVDLVRENGFVTRGLPLLRYSRHDLQHRPVRVVAEVERALRQLA